MSVSQRTRTVALLSTALFIAMLSKLLTAYSAQSLDDVLVLYDEASRQKIRTMLGDDQSKAAWLTSIAGTRALTPEFMWWEGNQVYCFVRARFEGQAVQGPLIMSFDENARLTTGQSTSAMIANLSRYFNDPKNAALSLLANRNYLEELFR